MREILAGTLLLCAIVPLAVIGYLVMVYSGLFGDIKRARAGARAMDNFVNATIFKGHAWESVSSHAWRERDNKWWAKYIIKLTDFFQKDHCKRANKREQKVVDLILSKGLNKQTIGKKK